jgi:pilus assembly protein CpaB
MPGVIKTAAHGEAGPVADSTKAAEGVALDALAGSTGGAGASRIVPLPRLPAPIRTAANTNNTGNAGGNKGGIEVIRGGRAETVAW